MPSAWKPKPAWTPKLVALDVDGTLLEPDAQVVSEAVGAAVHRAVEAGALVVIATGRSTLGTRPVLAALGLTGGTALCSNGAVRMDAATGEVLAVDTFDPAPVQAALAARLPGAIFAAERIDVGSLVTSKFREEALHGPQRLASLDELLAEPTSRLIANWADHDADELLRVMAGVEFPSCTLTIDHYQPWVTVVPAGVTKGAALEKLRVELGVPAEDTFAAGDGDNDIEMLTWAAHGVAMGQAPEVVRAAADEITATVDDDGLAKALDRWFR
ncbi:HAD family hydrolase [Saccharopolyspora taberi]|uniref:Cof-type HAD-IIB family hydrolase n=1 Tax=Saccharopolyspora taberi TaxID=60895 RepID=A0ABN3VL70_9PSEU